MNKLELYDWQEEILLSSAKRILVSASRQSGKSMLSHLKAYRYADDNPQSVVVIVSPTRRQADSSWNRWIIPALRGASVEAGRIAKLPNGSCLVSAVGEREARGTGANLVIMDEAAYVGGGVFCAIGPMLAAVNSSLMLISTPDSRRGVFHEEWSTGDGWQRHMASAELCPHLTKEYLIEERESLGARYYAQEYGAAFVGMPALFENTA